MAALKKLTIIDQIMENIDGEIQCDTIWNESDKKYQSRRIFTQNGIGGWEAAPVVCYTKGNRVENQKSERERRKKK